MKKPLLIFTASIISMGLWAQPNFMDDFESYTAGQRLGPQSTDWTTWSNADGGSEDVYVVDNMAASGSQSIHFLAASANGGPTDVILPIGTNLNTGTLNYSMNMNVASGKGGYFNFQKEPAPGITWALEVYLVQDGTVLVVDDGTVVLTANYPHNQWFKFEFDINFNTNTWEVLLDDVSQGSFANTENEISTVDIFPVNPSNVGGNGLAEYWIDDVSYTIGEYVLPDLNAGVVGVAPITGLVGQTRTPSISIRNLGVDMINSVDISVTYGSDSFLETFSGLTLGSLDIIDFTLGTDITLEAGNTQLTVTITGVNGGGADDDAGDDEFILDINAISPAPGKMVLGEEGTGTWCQWCPRGAVAMEHMAEFYSGYWAGIAVHNGDPMAFGAYDNYFSSAIGNSYPGGIVDRTVLIDPSGFEQVFMDRITMAPKVWLENGAQYDEINHTLEVSVTSNIQQNITGNYKLVCVLTENDVTGTTSGYAQSNAYAGGGNGPMGGYENLPSMVPASIMVYDDVARALSPSYSGQANAYGLSADAGDEFVHNFTFTIPLLDNGSPMWDIDEMNIVAFVMNPSGVADNASHSSIDEAIDNGFEDGTVVTGIESPSGPDANIKLYPNPTSSTTTLTLDITDRAEVTVRIVDGTGRLVAARNYGAVQGAYDIELPTANLSKGLYLVSVQIGDVLNTRKLVVE